MVSMAKVHSFISRRKTYRSIEQKVTTRDPIDKIVLSPIVCSVVDLREFYTCKREHIPRLYMQICTALSFMYVRDSGYACTERQILWTQLLSLSGFIPTSHAGENMVLE